MEKGRRTKIEIILSLQMVNRSQILRLVNDYIGGHGGYLGDFTYRTHHEFYPCYCGLDIDPDRYQGTTRERFIFILSQAVPHDQAKIVHGVFAKYPCNPDTETDQKRKAIYLELSKFIAEIDGAQVSIEVQNYSEKKVVLHALQDAELLLKERGAKSAIDRVHTAIHGYLKSKCEESNLSLSKDANVIECFKVLRSSHPAFASLGEHHQEVGRVLGGLSSMIDALNTLRNRGSLAHPNDAILEDAESNLMINAAKTLLRYVSDKIERGSTQVSGGLVLGGAEKEEGVLF